MTEYNVDRKIELGTQTADHLFHTEFFVSSIAAWFSCT
jgi:hypothetical protein